MEVTNYITIEMRQFWHWTVSLLTAALQTVCYAQETSKTELIHVFSISTCLSNVLNITGLILNGKRSVLANSIEFHSFMTIMHTCLILNRQKTMNMDDFWFFQWHFHWFHQCGLDSLTLILICPACCLFCCLREVYTTWLSLGLGLF